MFNKAQTAFIFPGQGSQHIGMGRDFYGETATREIFQQADEILGQNLTKLMFEGDAAELTKTANTQPALLLTSYVAWVYLQKQLGQNIAINDIASFVVGHSLGEYSALCTAQAFDFTTALRLVRLRGVAMQNAGNNFTKNTGKNTSNITSQTTNNGAMSAILGLDIESIKEIVKEANCWIANDNSLGQVVISGEVDAIETAEKLAIVKGAKRVVRLGVSIASHCPLMQSAGEKMAEALAGTQMKPPKLPVIANITATPETNPQEIKRLLVQQVTERVRWRESMEYLANQGVTDLYELGSGKILTGLAKRCDKRLKSMALNSPRDIDNLLENINK